MPEFPESSAARAGLRPEDLIVAVGAEPVENAGDLQRLMVAELIGAPVPLAIIRDGRLIDRQSGFSTASALRDWIGAKARE